MNSEAIFSSFTPSAMSPQTLEAIFVQREPLAQQIQARIRESAFTDAKSHTLLVGPRGIGKTHIVSLLYHRIHEEKDLAARLRIAWLREENWEITSFLELLESILTALAGEYPETGLKDRIGELIRLDVEEAEAEAERLLLEILGDRTLLLIVENLNELFEGLEEDGQHALRAFLENHRNTVLLATTPSLFHGVSEHESPFYNFFNVSHLRELTRKEAAEMLEKVAQLRRDQELADYLHTDSADNRLQVVEDLAGGHPRIWILFAGCLTRSLLDELVPLFMKMLDDLTPYYQDRMRYLPPQQRKIVVYLCKRQGAIPVKEIAEGCRLAPQGTAAQLHQLEEKGYVRTAKESDTVARSGGDRRTAYYELREPLMRLCFDVKESRGKPIQLIVDFLRLWYEPPTLSTWLDALPTEAGVERQYVSAALSLSTVKTALGSAEQSSADTPLPPASLDAEIERLRDAGDFEAIVALLTRRIQWKTTNGKLQKASDWDTLGYWLVETKNYEEALKATERAIEINPDFARAHSRRGVSLSRLDRHEEALQAFDKAIEIDPNYALAHNNRGNNLDRLGRNEEALQAFDKAIEIDPNYALAHNNRGNSLGRLGRHEEALQAYEQSLACNNPDPSYPQFGRIRTLLQLGRWDQAVEALRESNQTTTPIPPHASGITKQICQTLLAEITEIHNWSKRIESLIDIYATKEILADLGQGVTQSIRALFAPTITDFIAERWRDAWREAAVGKDELEIPIRLLDAAVKWREKRDRKHLLALAIEERRVLETLLPKS